LYKACVEGADMSIGSRYTKGGGVKNWPMDRLLLSYGASVYVRMITWMWVKDPTAGFICYSRRVLEAMDFSKIRFSGYAFQIEMKYYAYTLGFKIKEVPITFSDREKGESKMNTNIVQEAIKGVIGLRLRAIKGYYSKQSS
jgi:dolichol-phosphate mannosyltransferase